MHIEQDNQGSASRRRFLTRSRIRLPVGWQAIDLFPPFSAEVWKPEFARSWAERDLLPAALLRNIRDSEFRAIDPHSDARRRMSKLLADCETLLDGSEEPIHQFIKENPALLSPTHDRVWSKLPFGRRISDFVFREPSGEYVLVELERPSLSLFRTDGQQREELTHAIDQILDWRRYIEDNLRTVQSELGLVGISANPRCLIVIGRGTSLTDDDRRKLITIQNSFSKLSILTYDDVLANARSTAENILGPLWHAGPETEVYLLGPTSNT